MTELGLGNSTQNSATPFAWSNVNLDWTEDDVIAVRLVRTKTIPKPPTDLTATTTLQGRIDLSWNAPEDNGGSQITGYAIEVASNSAGTDRTTLVENTGSTSTTYSHTGLPQEQPAITGYRPSTKPAPVPVPTVPKATPPAPAMVPSSRAHQWAPAG